MLTPQAHVYLRYPILSSSETMLYHTLQHLCFTGALLVRYGDVRVGLARDRVVRRLYLERDRRVAAANNSEAFALDFFPNGKRLTLGDVRKRFEREISDYERFKYDLLWPELREAGLLSARHWRTAYRREALRRTRDLLFTVQQDIGRGLLGGWERSLPHVQTLGSSIVLLNERTRDQLKAASPRKKDLVAVFSILHYLEGQCGLGQRWLGERHGGLRRWHGRRLRWRRLRWLRGRKLRWRRRGGKLVSIHRSAARRPHCFTTRTGAIRASFQRSV